MGRIILIATYKGGVGKSTIAVNLAAALRQRDKSAVIADLDSLNRTSASWRQNAEHEGDDASHPIAEVIQLSGQVDKQLQKYASMTDFMIVDAAGGAARETQLALSIADVVLIPSAASGAEVQPTFQLCRELEAVQVKNGGKPQYRVVVTRVNPRARETADFIDMLTSGRFPCRPARGIIPHRAIMSQGFSMGRTVFDAKRSEDLQQEFLKIADEVIELAT